MATSNDLLIKKLEKRPVIEFFAAEVCSATNIHTRMKTVYDEMCISECKAQSMEYRHKTSPSPGKFKVLFTVFLDTEGVVHMTFLEQGQTEM
ncbi:hypothetical protein ElyMa_006983200 [Elysia marginata]|uniref:Tim10-like domain-containing protein n=1 Tax=Elysia marginata TaxID=1093978 RepID=A0AAV4JPN7_9GAST|nr:hypothetical protein ElyMa_006983200 [Elysia marginata]